MIEAKDIMFRYNFCTKVTYIRMGNVIIGTIRKFKGDDRPFTVSYSTFDNDDSQINVNKYFETRKQAIDHIVGELSSTGIKKVGWRSLFGGKTA